MAREGSCHEGGGVEAEWCLEAMADEGDGSSMEHVEIAGSDTEG